MTTHDWLLFRRTLSMSVLLLALVALVVLSTDEAFSTPGMRVARLCAFAPAIAGIAVLLSFNLARRRGELRALEALGASPWMAGWGALVAAWLFGAFACVLLLTPWSDVSSLFPEPPLASGWVAEQQGFFEPAHGIRVLSDGSVSFAAKRATIELAPPGRLQALSAVLPLALVLPAWLLAPLGLGMRAWGLATSVGFTLVALHAVALGRVPEILLPLAAAPLAAQLGFALERGRMQVTVFSAMLGRRR